MGLHKPAQKLTGHWEQMGFCCIKRFRTSKELAYVCKQFVSTLSNGLVLNGEICCGALKSNQYLECVTFVGVLGENFI